VTIDVISIVVNVVVLAIEEPWAVCAPQAARITEPAISQWMRCSRR